MLSIFSILLAHRSYLHKAVRVAVFFFIVLLVKNPVNAQAVKDEYISKTTEVIASGFFIPPSLSSTESAKTLTQWFVKQSDLCHSISKKTVCIFRIFQTRERNYAIYLAFAKQSDSTSNGFEYVSSVGNSFQIPLQDAKSLTYDQVLQKVLSEYRAFSQTNKHKVAVFEKGQSVNITYDNFHIVKLH